MTPKVNNKKNIKYIYILFKLYYKFVTLLKIVKNKIKR